MFTPLFCSSTCSHLLSWAVGGLPLKQQLTFFGDKPGIYPLGQSLAPLQCLPRWQQSSQPWYFVIGPPKIYNPCAHSLYCNTCTCFKSCFLKLKVISTTSSPFLLPCLMTLPLLPPLSLHMPGGVWGLQIRPFCLRCYQSPAMVFDCWRSNWACHNQVWFWYDGMIISFEMPPLPGGRHIHAPKLSRAVFGAPSFPWEDLGRWKPRQSQWEGHIKLDLIEGYLNGLCGKLVKVS